MKTTRADTHSRHQQKENIKSDKISQIKQLMKESCEEFHSVEFLCEQIGETYNTFRKSFRDNEGMGLSEFLQQCRLQNAKELLFDKGSCNYQVAVKMGFSSDAYFTNWFKKQTGKTPTEYREQQINNKA